MKVHFYNRARFTNRERDWSYYTLVRNQIKKDINKAKKGFAYVRYVSQIVKNPYLFYFKEIQLSGLKNVCLIIENNGDTNYFHNNLF